MAFVDFFPIASTINHIMSNPKGMRVSDYACNMDSLACTGNPATIAAAVTACERDIDRQLIAFIQKFVGGIPNAIFHDVVGDIAGVAIAYLAKTFITKAGGISIPWIGAGLVLDSFIDIGIVISKLNRMKDAAARAKAICCKCNEAPCSNAKLNSTPLEISKWYLGPRRSYDQTTAEAQDYADKTYTCNGTCTAGTCKPKIYILESSQSHFAMSKTWLKYDVYCECR